MGIIDKLKFEARGGYGCSNSDYLLHRTNCCGLFCVEDDELSQLYIDPTDLTKAVDFVGPWTCPACGAKEWTAVEIVDLSDVPEAWAWACKSAAEAEWSRRVGELQAELRANPSSLEIAVKLWDALGSRKNPGGALACFGGCAVNSDQGCVALAHAIKGLPQGSGMYLNRLMFSDATCTALRATNGKLTGTDREDVQWLLSMLDIPPQSPPPTLSLHPPTGILRHPKAR